MHRRHFLASLASFIPASAFAAPPTTALRPIMRNSARIQALAGATSRVLDPALANITGYALVDVETGRLVDGYQADLALPPASVTKALTAVYARSVLGPDYRFVTRVFATGPSVDGIIQGDLVLVGGGDPALDTDELAELARAAVSAGVRGVTGKFIVDGSVFPDISEIDPAQPEYLGYNPSVSGLNLNFNRVYFEWKQASAGYNLTLDARGERHRPAVQRVEIQAEDRGAPVFVYASRNGLEKWSVAKSALGAGGGRWLPVRQPVDYAGEVFNALAMGAGLKLPAHSRGVLPTGAREIARFESNPLDEVLRWMLKYSNNLTAECLGLAATQKLGRKPQSLQSSASSMRRWAHTNLGGFEAKLVNHSGLTDVSRVSAAQMAGLLAHARSDVALDQLMKPFKLLDRNGNLSSPSGVQVSAKTGTLNFTRGLAGYIDKEGRKYGFAIFAADLNARTQIPMAERERPRGAKSWSTKAKRQEQALLRQWTGSLG